ncbi:tectonic-like complex member MKS1 [Battus philenor]|uniref:tectonic-like complex member MKS1 n=1 Tax=Battus philenor TaxID=42288 RepID=UPI0035CFBE8C
MHVVFDDSLYTEDSQLIRKQEYLMLSMFYNTIDNCLIVTPDVNDLVFNPYDVAMENAAPAIQYGVQINFGEFEKDEELVELLNKLHKRWQKKHKQLVRFAQAPLGIKKHYLMFEIMSASGFDMDNIYIEYDIKVPENIRCENTLHGRTHVSKGRSVDGCQEWSYGHFIELELEVAEEIEPSPLQMYFETISTDWWGRHRTEGYYYLPMPLSPGNFTKHLSSSRPEERNKVEADSRRFFVGGCHLIRDLEVLSKPQLQNADFTYTATGSVRVRWSIVAHTNTPGFEPASTVPSGSSTALLLGAEAVLKQYSQARARLAAATKDLEGDED